MSHWVLVLACLGGDDFPVFEGRPATRLRVIPPHALYALPFRNVTASGVLNTEELGTG